MAKLCLQKGGRLLPVASDGAIWSIYEVTLKGTLKVTLSIQYPHPLIVDVGCILGPLTLTPVPKAAGFQQQQMHQCISVGR